MTTRPEDALKYVAALLKSRTEWIGDAISGNCDDGGHDDELAALDDTVREVIELAAQFGDPRRYTNGRLVQSSAEIVPGLVTAHVWKPDPAAEAPTSWRAPLPADPDTPSAGVYEVEADPLTQRIHTRVVRLTS